MEKLIKMNCVGDMNKFFEGRKILVVGDHDWVNEEVDFIEMVNKDDTVPNDDQKPNAKLRMKVKTRFGTFLSLESENVFVITKKITQQPSKN